MQTQPTHKQGKRSRLGTSRRNPARNTRQYVGHADNPSAGPTWMNRVMLVVMAALCGASLWMFFLHPMDLIWLGASLAALAVTDYGLQSIEGRADDVREYVSAFVASGWMLALFGLSGGSQAGAAIAVLIVTTVAWAFLATQGPVSVDRADDRHLTQC